MIIKKTGIISLILNTIIEKTQYELLQPWQCLNNYVPNENKASKE